MTDVSIRQTGDGTVRFNLLTPLASEWVESNIIEEHDLVDNVLYVEPRFASEIRFGMEEDGLEVDS